MDDNKVGVYSSVRDPINMDKNFKINEIKRIACIVVNEMGGSRDAAVTIDGLIICIECMHTYSIVKREMIRVSYEEIAEGCLDSTLLRFRGYLTTVSEYVYNKEKEMAYAQGLQALGAALMEKYKGDNNLTSQEVLSLRAILATTSNTNGDSV
jgi:hypothetical protein